VTGVQTCALPISDGMAAQQARVHPGRPLALVLLGAVDEAALYIANAEDPNAARSQMEPVLLSLLDGQRG